MKRSAKRFKAAPGSALSDKQAVVLGSEFDSMIAQGVELTPQAVVERASNRASPLHKFFDWNDESAATKQRISYARYLIRSVVEIHVEINEPVRSYQNLVISPETNGHLAYKRRDMLDESETDQVAGGLFRRLLSIIREAEALSLGRNKGWAVIIKSVHAMRGLYERKSA